MNSSDTFVSRNTSKFKSFLVQCQRVWLVLRKPTREELLMVAKIAGLGILVVGALGFIISDLIKVFVKAF